MFLPCSGSLLARIAARRKEEAMRSWSTLSTIALVGVLTAAPAYAKDSSVKSERPYDRLAFPYGDALTQSDLQDAARMCCAPAQSAMTSEAIIEGKVATVDHDSGWLVLDTNDGFVSLTTWPSEVVNVDVGDLVRVSFVTDDSD